MKVIVQIFALSLLFVCARSFAGGDSNNHINLDGNAAATSNSATTIMGTPPSPVVGLPGSSQSSPPPLVNQVPPPPYVLFHQLMDITSQFGDVVISGEKEVEQFTTKTDAAEVTFAPSPRFEKYKKVTPWDTPDSHMTARFTQKYSGKVSWLGTIFISSKNGVVLLPPADKGFVWKAINSASSQLLKNVMIVPLPRGYGVNVGVKSEGSALGVSSAFGKLLSVFIGLGPSYSMQDGTTMPTGTWSQQYIVLEEDENGIPFEINLVDQKKAVAENTPPAPDRVQIAREEAVRQAQALAEATARIRQNMTLTLNVPTNEVVREQKTCKVQELTLESGEKVKACIGPKSGSYGVTRVVPRTATGQLSVLTE